MLRLCSLVILLFFTSTAMSTPKITVKHQRTAKDFAQVQVINETLEKLICHVAIDGHKKRFYLLPYEASPWYTATDKRFNHRHFSVWCNLATLHEN